MNKISSTTKSLEGFQQVQNLIYSEAKEILRAETSTKTTEEFYEARLRAIATETKNTKQSAKECGYEITEKLIPKVKTSQQHFKEFVSKIDMFTDFFHFIEQFHSGINNRFENNATKFNNLEQTYNGIMEEFQKLKNWKQNYEIQLVELLNRKEAEQSKINSLEGQLMQLESQKRTEMEQLEDMKQTHQLLVLNCSASTQHLAVMQQELDTLQVKNSQLQSEISILEEKKRYSASEIIAAKERLNFLNDSIFEKEKEIESRVKQLFESTKSTLDGSIAQLEHSYSSLELQNRSVEDQIVASRAQTEKIKEQLASMQQEILVAEQKKIKMKDDGTILIQDIESTKKKILQQEKEGEVLDHKLSSLRESCSTEVETIRLHISNLVKEKDAMQSNIATNNMACGALKEQKQTAELKLQELMRELNGLVEEKAILAVEVNQVVETAEREQKISLDMEKDSDFELIKRQIDETKKDLEELQQQQDQMMRDIKAKIAALDEKTSMSSDELFEDGFSEYSSGTDEELEMEYTSRLSVQKNMWAAVLDEQRKKLQDLIAKKEQRSQRNKDVVIVNPSSASKKVQIENTQSNSLFNDDNILQSQVSIDFNSSPPNNNLFSQELSSTVEMKSKARGVEMQGQQQTPEKATKITKSSKSVEKSKAVVSTPKQKESKSTRKSDKKNTSSRSSTKAKTSKKGSTNNNDDDLSIFDFLV